MWLAWMAALPFTCLAKEHILSEKGEVVSIPPSDIHHLETFCTTGLSPSPELFWASSSLHLSHTGDHFSSYSGPNITSVSAQHVLAQGSLVSKAVSFLPWRNKMFRLDPFQSSCVGIASKERYSVRLEWRHVNYYQVVATVIGLAMFHWAPALCRSTTVHYTTGIGLGISLSLLILVMILQSRLRSSLGLGGLATAYLASLYGVTSSWYHLPSLLRDHLHWVLGYIVFTGLMSGALLYRLGPPSHPRTLDLLQWTLQLAGLVTMALSSHHQLYSFSLVLTVLAWAAIPAWLKAGARTQVRRNLWKPRVKLLSEVEFQEQTNVETRKALEELRRYCQSPSSNPWGTVARLNSPSRFAEFVEGSPHLTEKEVMEYSTWDSDEGSDDCERDQFTDDNSDDQANNSFDDQS